MPYSTTIEAAVDTYIRDWRDIEKKRMFGGICYLLGGNICFGIWRDFLIVRVGTELEAEKLREPHVKPFDVTGKPMKGWLMVAAEGVKDPNRLEEWLSLGRDFAHTLPRK